ncbi:MAG: hypothetical protein PWP23_2084 [Candidatus Sumerlaeota bacterium]|nr:hypothetical protein [Candidatus Sumerlaeota bacterium]
MNTAKIQVLLFVLLAIAALGVADSLVMKDGRTFPGVRVDGFQSNGSGGVFTVRMVENGAPSPQTHGVEANLINHLEFRADGDTGTLPQGRPATMVMTDGRMFAVTVEHAYPGTGGVTFHTRQQGVPYGGETHDVVSTRLRGLDFTGALSAAVPTPAPTPDATFAAGFDGEDTDSSFTDDDEEDDSSWEDEEPEGGFGPMDKLGGAAMLGMGIGVLIVGGAIAMIMQSVLIWIFVYLSAKVCKVQDFSLLKAYGTAWLLILAFLLAVPLGCVPLLGIFLFFAGWYFMSRAVIMGMMEVQESQAFMVILTYILLQIGAGFLLSQFQ